jgi:hypothetical protein
MITGGYIIRLGYDINGRLSLSLNPLLSQMNENENEQRKWQQAEQTAAHIT